MERFGISARTVPRPVGRLSAALLLGATLTACDGPQSALTPAGDGAERIAQMSWVLFIGAAVIWVVVIGLAVFASYASPRAHDPRVSRWLIIGGGGVFPTIVLAVLLSYNLYLMPVLRAEADPGSVRVLVTGEQWWWRVRYEAPDGTVVELANEIRLPLGERTAFDLASADVIHSFWIPSLGGKLDMIPGRVNRMVLEPTQLGTFRGACAEYCGTAHAEMNFAVRVMEPPAFRDWLAAQAEPAAPPAGPAAERGRALFLAYGCGACHTVRGTPADGRIGPDLTHVGSRLTLGAGILPNGPDDFMRWIADTHAVKPGANMPPFPLPAGELQDLAAWLDGLS